MNLPKLAHDIRGPVARARTMAYLMDGATAEELEEYRKLLLAALDEVEALLRDLDRAPAEE